MPRYSLLNHTVDFGSSGDAYPSTVGDAIMTNSQGGRCIAFKDAATGIIMGLWEVPDDLSAKTLNVNVVWTSSATSGNVSWEFYYKSIAGDDTTSLDVNVISSNDQNFTGQTDGGSTARSRRKKVIGTLTGSNFAADRTIVWAFRRLGGDGGDTMAAVALLLDLLVDAA